MKYATGASKSPYDIRTFSFKPTKANKKGGKRYDPVDIEDQDRVGICTSISLTQQARKATGVKYSADFLYLIQKKFVDGNWTEGSAIFSAIKASHKYGLLPEEEFDFNYKKYRGQTYNQYIKRLKAISDEDIMKYLSKCVKIKGYASVPPTRDRMAEAIDESDAGILARFSLGNEWYRSPIEPLRKPVQAISGHAVTETNYDGDSLRIANSWGSEWADGGTAYHTTNYMPTEAWIVYYNEATPEIESQQEARTKTIGIILDYLQKIIALLPKLV